MSGPSLVQDCCATVGSPGAAGCLFYTGCADFSAPVTSIPNILTWYDCLITFVEFGVWD